MQAIALETGKRSRIAEEFTLRAMQVLFHRCAH